MTDSKAKNSKASSPVVTEILARAMERQADAEPSKLDADRKRRTAIKFREKMQERHRPN